MFCFNLDIEPQRDLASDTSLISALWKANPGAKGSCFPASPVFWWCVSRVVSDSPNHTMTHEAFLRPWSWSRLQWLYKHCVSSSYLNLTFSIQRQKWNPRGNCRHQQMVWSFSVWRLKLYFWDKQGVVLQSVPTDLPVLLGTLQRTIWLALLLCALQEDPIQAFALWSYLQSLLLVLPLLGLFSALSVHWCFWKWKVLAI